MSSVVLMRSGVLRGLLIMFKSGLKVWLLRNWFMKIAKSNRNNELARAQN